MSKEIDEVELVQVTFSNDQGRKLLEHWHNLFGKRISYNPANTPEQTAFLEGQRYFYQSIQDMMEIPRK